MGRRYIFARQTNRKLNLQHLDPLSHPSAKQSSIEVILEPRMINSESTGSVYIYI
jgi:hypothetical protein